ncbi:DNA-directed RNA polymerase subunit beta' [Candidatus Roizmanbacteria bacterium RIFCSPHIGHO2_02_FULL_37_15]|uniref:DNA-directed RNA polymerase subunit beta' n=1 Tax=Candidatus Roizmanbacteria bacterium RIFCSPLOWO2_01_FULL_37_16 TaxID=1802058 RepID=A0A1F7IQ67_9BACT|nr:MAG: DNA-directed RNA polymerase subunit beta' [Candidatus Roizmanbacteria bacterium RIFCSPHIGHO2_01_FULL_37_16b]OGK21183.1 MAG: DNA-directed RNA polymerase subunit beta' [Candidatus Roizmanbacteria bacterium RIFCSPHIGHO2_02_FULL_37_15]OGK32866.1 MAG: DNA-directed RNA polymerase subunit beta' [Candidatus Roizmanbacteria bacterium RIFCSPHIGHO2_12_FULL_36_11]OGK45506.1 MAG: DNA-directed RNA polymerase subunit beta' [Candidatus Roizmanbacteria bacterium RIFCSPLOWO2_01_FULL_37_16]
MTFDIMDNHEPIDFSGLRISLASPEAIMSWSHGEITKPETINYRTFRAEKDGLFDERIFGPTKDYECYCGKYKRIRYKGIVCDRCGVEITTSAVRRERMGHIKLASPIAHIWYFKGPSSVLSTILDIPPQSMERIIYYALYLVKTIDKDKQKQSIKILDDEEKKELDGLQKELRNDQKKIENDFKKQKEDLVKKITNKEQREIAEQEIEFKLREQLKLLSDKFIEQKNKKVSFFDRLLKVVKSLKTLDTIEEDDYLYLKEKRAEQFIETSMGSEVIYEILSSFDVNKKYAEALKELNEVKGERRNKLLKKVRLLESFAKANILPKWIILTVLPVIPPDLRPVVQLPGGKFATSDLNDFYRRVINRNNRLKQLIDLGAPEIILRNEKRMLQEAVDSLIDLQKSRGRVRTQGAASKIQKSLSDILRGKQGRFRQNLLGKRVDYSGRSTIIVGPELKLYQCGLPKEMALELFKPFLLHEIIVRGLAPNIKSAKNFLEKKEPIVYDILEEISKEHPVLLNRAPTLHKLSILGFYPVLTDSYAIKLHPTVCAGYNADFDGDAMGVFLPLSKKAIEEVKNRMFPHHNLLKPADGTPIVLPNKEMALGCYHITTLDPSYQSLKDEELKYFANEDEATTAYQFEKISLRQLILVKIKNQLLRTTIGRIIFNQSLPQELRFINQEVKASTLKQIVMKAMKVVDNQEVGNSIDRLKEIGFWGATVAGGLSFSVFDCLIIKEKEEMLKQVEKEVEKVEKNYRQGLLTLEEKKRYTNKLWIELTEKLADLTWGALDEENPVKIAIKSEGPRASREQLKQLSAIKGLVVDPLGKIIEVPTKSNYREGLSIFEYVISARGARKGLTDSALKTADAGYLTRRLVDVAHDMIVREENCGVTDGITISERDVRGEKFSDRIKGRFTAKDLYSESKQPIIKANELIDEEKIQLLQKAGTKKIIVRSPLYCQSKYGVCQYCYGIDLSNNNLVDIGVPVGVIAAQSIGEPGTQLTMRVRHFGGIVIADVTQGLPRVEELFETRTPKIVSPIVEIDGRVSVQEDTEKEVYIVKVVSTDKTKPQEQEFIIPLSQKLKIKDGELVTIGTPLSEGYLDVDDILTIKGLRAAQFYLLDEIQKVYESQGINIHDKHFEVVIRKMSDKVTIEDEGDTSFIKDEVVSRIRFEEENKKILTQGGKPSVGKVSILGITRAAIYTDSWLSAASFEQTTNVLSSAAIKGKIDYLLGLKENVIIGRLIPVTAELIEKYYGRFLSKYAYDKPTNQKKEEKEN